MRKLIIISAFFLLPFVTFTSFAQYELTSYELPSDYYIYWEPDEPYVPDESQSEEKEITTSDIVMVIVIGVLLILLIIVVGSVISINSAINSIGD